MAPVKFGVGQSVLRKEDDALIRGRGRYTDDHAPSAALHALVLRSPHAHAKFTIDASRARALPGVAAILTAEDVRDLGTFPCIFNLPNNPYVIPPYTVLANGVARHVGDAVAFVVAETLNQARDAIEAVQIDWTPLPAVIGAANAVKPDAPQVWPDHAGNVLYDVPFGDKKATDAAFAKAARRRRDLDRQSPRCHQLHGDARRGLRIRRQARSSDADDLQPGQPPAAGYPLQGHPEDPDSKRCGSSAPMSAAVSAPSCFPIANMRWPRSPRANCARP